MFTMAVKTITVTEEAYNALRRLKGGGESFSEVILKVTKNKIDFTKYAGVLSEHRAKELKEHVKRTRERISRDMTERVKYVHSR